MNPYKGGYTLESYIAKLERAAGSSYMNTSMSRAGTLSLLVPFHDGGPVSCCSPITVF
jgi:hypothetical protein